MNKFAMSMKKVGVFMKRNAFYFLIILCIASVATVVALAATGNLTRGVDGNLIITPPDDGEDVNKPIPTPEQTFIAPSSGEISKHFTNSAVIWDGTAESYHWHKGIDFSSKTDLNVVATCAGTIKEVGYSYNDGNYVIISHDNGFESHYSSLATKSTLLVGAKVTQGQKLGEISKTQQSENFDDAHVHFELWKNNAQINPLEVLILDEK